MFDKLDPIELCKARSRANPFESIKSAFFMNRAALKMANIDAVTGFMFSNVDRQVNLICYIKYKKDFIDLFCKYLLFSLNISNLKHHTTLLIFVLVPEVSQNIYYGAKNGHLKVLD